MTHNPLTDFYRTPKLYVSLPSQGKFYSDDVMVISKNEQGDIPVLAMTARDEMMMKNPDALLNGEAVVQTIISCVPGVKSPRQMISIDIDALLIAIQSATYGDELEVAGNCPKCKEEITSVVSIESVLSTMDVLEKSYVFTTNTGLSVEIRPFTYASTIKAGIANFQSTQSLKHLTEVDDEMEQLRRFNDNFVRVAALNFDLIADSVASIRGQGKDGEDFIVTDRESIADYLNNCDGSVAKQIEEKIKEINTLGLEDKVQLHCEECDETFEEEIQFDPVNFSTAS